MADLKEKAVALLGSVDSVNMNSAAATTLYTVPTGKKCTLSHAVIRNVSATLATNPAVVTIGQVGALTDFLGSQTLTNVDAAAKTCVLAPIPAATPVTGIEYTAGEVLQIDVATASGGVATATVELFGTIDDA